MGSQFFDSIILIAVVDYRAIVAGKKDQCVIQNSFFGQFIYDLTDAPIGLSNRIASGAHVRRAHESGVGDPGHVDIVKGKK